MSTHPATRSRWIDWQPKARILADATERKPTKPSKPSFVGFDGVTPGKSRKIDSPAHAEDVRGGESSTPWAEWKAAELNRLFQEQGMTGEPGRITAETIRHRQWRES